MDKTKHNFPQYNCIFATERLQVVSWQNYTAEWTDGDAFAERTISILTPEVTKSLPEGWQMVRTVSQARQWINARNQESDLFVLVHNHEDMVVGFLFLFRENTTGTNRFNVHLGYLLSKDTWGKGLGSELIKGLVNWCDKEGNVSSLSGGVEIDNKASIRVLEKNGFCRVTTQQSSEDTLFFEKRF